MEFVKVVKNDSSVVKAVQATDENITKIYFYLSSDLGCEVNHYFKDPASGLQFVFFEVPVSFTCYDVIRVGDWLVVDGNDWYAVNREDFSKSYRLEKEEPKEEPKEEFKCPGYEKYKNSKTNEFNCPGIESFKRLTVGMFDDIHVINKKQNILKVFMYANIGISVLNLVVLVIHMLMQR